MPQYNVDVLVISIANPILVGIYKDDSLLETISHDGKTSDILPIIFKSILDKYTLNELMYINGPGSFMAIKIGYMYLKTLSITNDLIFKASDGFNFNNNSPIKALGKKYFFKNKDGSISIEFLKDNTIQEDFILPQILNKNIFSEDVLPNYNLPAVN